MSGKVIQKRRYVILTKNSLIKKFQKMQVTKRIKSNVINYKVNNL